MAEDTNNLKKILFVDDSVQFLEMIVRVMGEWSRGEWQIFQAQNTGQALIVLQEHSVDLVVVDVQMPVVDGIQFLGLLGRKYPNVQKVTLSAYADNEARTAALAQGAELFLEKPRDSAGLEAIFSTLKELARHKPTTGFRGVLRQVSLEDVIQMECLNRNSSILEVNAGQLRGQVFIKQGSIVHAQVGERKGEAAFIRIMALKGGEFSLKPFVEPPQQTIDGQWEFLLMEAAQSRDEASQKEGEETPPEAPVIPDQLLKPAFVPAPPVVTISPPTVTGEFASAGRHARINEMVVCTGKGEILYEWQSVNSSERISLLEFLSQKSSQLGEGLALGSFDRLEIEDPRFRVIAQAKTDRGLFVHLTKMSASQPQE